MKKTVKKVTMTTDEKVFNLCVESAKNSKNGYTFDLKDVWKAARLKYKLAKQTVIDAFEILVKEHEIKKVGEGPSNLFSLVELMPKEEKKAEPTPIMKQFRELKAKHPDALILFRCGDFYETYNEDAEKCGRILGIIVRKYHETEANDIKVAGFPYHALDTYLPKLVRAGYRVAICDQLEDPKLTKKLVKRSITELVTPGIAKELPAENAKVVAIKQEEKAATEMVGDMALLQPSKVCTGQNEMRTVLMEEVDADKVVVRQVNGNGDFGICVCLKEKKAVAIACWERSGVNGKREYRFCSMAPKFREFSKAL